MYKSRIPNEQAVMDVVGANCTLTGRELAQGLGISYEQRDKIVQLWALCTLIEAVCAMRVFDRYLRIDKLTGQLQLTPSIPREFADFTALGLQPDKVKEKAATIKERAKQVSEGKKALLQHIVATAVGNVRSKYPTHNPEQYFCFLMAGDATYGMSHDFEREGPNGENVKGSDLDLVVIHSEYTPPSLVERLDEAVYDQKLSHLRHPHREEVDYIVKSLNVVRGQAHMRTPRDAIACKIVLESVVVYGNHALYVMAMDALKAAGAPEKLQKMMSEATLLRREEEKGILEELALSRNVVVLSSG